jgi:hypothetical protein
MIEWHPTAENILVSAGYEHIIIIWDISRGTQVSVLYSGIRGIRAYYHHLGYQQRNISQFFYILVSEG